MKESDVILTRQSTRIRFRNQDMDFMLNWLLSIGEVVGFSHGEVFWALRDVRDGDARSWREGFGAQHRAMVSRAERFEREGNTLAAGQALLGAAFAQRAVLQYEDPTAADFLEHVSVMERSFQEGTRRLGIPVRAIEIPFGDKALPGYFLEHGGSRPTLVMIGGGDTFREDLWYFAGHPGWHRGWNVLMVDLPGQGKTPSLGLHFSADAWRGVPAALEWLAASSSPADRVALYGVSGGGYLSAQAVAADERIAAWIASTPIYDIGRLFEREFGPAANAPGWLINSVLRLAGAFNASAELNLKKYAWQFGTTDFAEAVRRVRAEAPRVDAARLRVPSLFLVGEGEAKELKVQAHELHAELINAGRDSTLRSCTGDEGADAHCQLNNLRFAHALIFDWLAKKMDAPAAIDPRMVA